MGLIIIASSQSFSEEGVYRETRLAQETELGRATARIWKHSELPANHGHHEEPPAKLRQYPTPPVIITWFFKRSAHLEELGIENFNQLK